MLAFVNQTGMALYESLDDVRRAGLLNIGVKTGTTSLANGRNVLSYIRSLTELRGDRFFAVVSPELREKTKNSLDEGLGKRQVFEQLGVLSCGCGAAR